MYCTDGEKIQWLPETQRFWHTKKQTGSIYYWVFLSFLSFLSLAFPLALSLCLSRSLSHSLSLSFFFSFTLCLNSEKKAIASRLLYSINAHVAEGESSTQGETGQEEALFTCHTVLLYFQPLSHLGNPWEDRTSCTLRVLYCRSHNKSLGQCISYVRGSIKCHLGIWGPRPPVFSLHYRCDRYSST